MTTTTTKKYSYADSNGNWDKEAVRMDIRNGVEQIEIDFSAYAAKLSKDLSKQEDYYKK